MTRSRLQWRQFHDTETAVIMRHPVRWTYGLIPFYALPPRYSVRINGVEIARAATIKLARVAAELDYEKRRALLPRLSEIGMEVE